MNQTARRCLAAFAIAVWVAGAPRMAVAEETGPVTGSIANSNPSSGATASVTPAVPAKPGKRESYPFRGVVASVDAGAKTVTLEGRGTRRVIAVTAETRLTRRGEVTTLDDVKPGEKVGGTLKKNAGGREEALLLKVGLRADDEGSDGRKTGSRRGKSKASG